MNKNNAIIKLFEKAGVVGSQPNLIKMFKEKFLKMTWDEFNTTFKSALMSMFISENAVNCVFINNMIKFAANGVSILTEQFTIDGRSGMYLISEIFRLCRTFGRANIKAIRWRFCLFLNHLLNYMAEETSLSVEMCDIATLFLLERLKDKKPDVRVQAALALNRLQLPNNPNCPIVKKFIFHMTSDTNVEVRITIVKKIAMFNNVIEEMLKNTVFDISDNVRKEMYNRFVNYPFFSLSSKQRQKILENGLKDENANIISLVKKRLIVKWLDACNNDVIVFLEQIGVENELVCENTLNTMFESYYDSQILDLINKYLNSDSRMIDFEILTVENIFLWKCVAKYLTTEKKIELARNQGHFDDYYIDILLPDLVKFSDYIREYYFTYNSKKDKEFIMTQLLNVARTFTFDDVGVTSLNKLVFDLILDNEISVKPMESMVLLLDLTFKHRSKDLLLFVKHTLNEIQARTIDLYPIIDKIGKKQILKHQITSITEKIEELNQNSDELKSSNEKLNKMNKEYIEIIVLPKEEILANIAIKNLNKGFELIFQVQQLPKVSHELSLLTDIIQNIVIEFLKCSMVELRMEAIRSLSPYLLANNVNAAKKHIVTLCSEIANPLTNRNLLFNIMFELFLRYDLKDFGIHNVDLDMVEVCDNIFSIHNILSLLADTIEYTVDDNSFKLTVVKGFCQLLIFQKVKSVKLLSKFLIIWNRRVSYDTYNIYNCVVKFITSYCFFIRSSSSTFAKCYVPVLRDLEEYDLITKLDIKLTEINRIFINLTRGIMFRDEKLAINSHGELAIYILDYLVDEEQPYTSMLVDTLYKLDITFDNNEELIIALYPKVKRVIKHFKTLDDNRNINRYLKKIKNKFNQVLQNKKTFLKKKELDIKSRIENELSVASCSTQESKSVEVHGDLFLGNHAVLNQSSEDEDDEEFAKLDAIKRMSEIFKKSFKEKSINNSS